jgi:hypothetical protein
MKMIIRTIVIGCILLAGIAVVDGLFSGGIFIKEAPAARNTGRRCRSCPPDHTTRYSPDGSLRCDLAERMSGWVIEETTLHQCGGTYYQSSGDQYVVVEVE